MAVVRLTRPLSGEAGEEAHDGVVINDGGGGEDEVGVELGLVDVRRAELGLGVPGGPAGIVIGGEEMDERHSSGAFWVCLNCGLKSSNWVVFSPFLFPSVNSYISL